MERISVTIQFECSLTKEKYEKNNINTDCIIPYDNHG